MHRRHACKAFKGRLSRGIDVHSLQSLPLTNSIRSLWWVQDLPRTFPHNVWVASPAGQTALRRVLLAFSMHKPAVGYCQSMNYIAAMLLLVLNKLEEDAFWVLVALIDDGEPAPSSTGTCVTSAWLLCMTSGMYIYI